MSEQSKKVIKKFRRAERAESTAERRWTDRDKTLQRRQARYIKSVSRNV
ncbi:hypothetical protein [Kitasatospora acidiphila]|nr:hypothetical protein [Kitasatospora acidiphila]